MHAFLTVLDTRVCCLLAQMGADGHYQIVAEQSERISPIRQNRPVQSFGIRAAARDVLAKLDDAQRIDGVYVGVPGAFCQTVTLRGTKEQREREQSDWLGDNQYDLIHQQEISQSEAVLLLALRSFTDEIAQAVRDCRLTLCGMYAQTMVEGMQIIARSMREQVAILLHIGYYHTDISLFTGRGQVFSATMFVGGEYIVTDLATVLSIDRSQAEQLKLRFAVGMQMPEGTQDYVRMPDGRLTGFDHALVDQVITARLEEMCELVGQALEHSGLEFSANSRVYVIGDGVQGMPGLREYVGTMLGFQSEGLPVYLADGTTRNELSAIALLEYVLRHNPPKRKASWPLGRFLRK